MVTYVKERENHYLNYQTITNETTVETTEDGKQLTVQTQEYAWVCTNCGYTQDRRKTVNKTDENGNTVYSYDASYAVNNETEYLQSENVYEFAVGVRADGTVFTYKIKQSYTWYSDPEKADHGWTDVYEYAEGNYCVANVTRTHLSGATDSFVETNHKKMETVYELMEGATSCLDGLYCKQICRECAQEISSKPIYRHYLVSQTVELTELGAVCGGTVQIRSCPCGQQSSVMLKPNCKYDQQDMSFELDGVRHDLWVYTCSDPACGFSYSREKWTEIDESCKQFYHEKYRFGISEDGSAKLETSRTVDQGYSHNVITETIEKTQKTETDANGNELTVDILEERGICTGCQAVQDHMKTITHTDANGRQIYTYTAYFTYPEDGGDPYVCNDEEIFYVERTLPNGETRLYTAKHIYADYDSEGNTIYGWTRTYEYTEGNFCSYKVLFVSSNGKEDVEEHFNHENVKITTELLEGSINCDMGWIYRETCLDCGAIAREETRYWHDVFETTVSMKEHGSVCGGEIILQSCPCGQTANVLMGSMKCSFDKEPQGWTDDNGIKHSVTVYTCINEGCGFSYSYETYTDYDESCQRKTNRIYRFGLDADGNASYEKTFVSIKGISHKYEQVEISSKTSTETDANGATLNVTETVYRTQCIRCGNEASNNQQIVIEKTDANGNVLYRSEQNYASNEKEGEYLQNETVETFIAVALSDGTYQTYKTLSEYSEYDVLGTKYYWWKHEYTYSSNSYCKYTESYTNVHGESWNTEHVNHAEWTESYEFLNNGNTCDNGVRITQTCVACGEVVNTFETWGHDLEHKRIEDLADVGNACGGWIDVNTCKRCKYASVGRQFNCKMEGTLTSHEVDENGFDHSIWTYQCNTCGFSYTDERCYTVMEDCTVYRSNVYSFGIDEAGNAKLQVSSYRYYTTNHEINHESTDPVESVETDANGNVLTVRSWENLARCTKCGKVESHYAYVEKFDANNTLVYSASKQYETRNGVEFISHESIYVYDVESGQTVEQTDRYYTLNGDGTQYLREQTTWEYGVALRADGSYRNYLTKREYKSYNSDGEQIGGDKHTYVYPTEGDFCNRTEIYENFDGATSENAQINHEDYFYVYELMEGAISCYEGVHRKQICKDCGYEENVETYYSHQHFWTEYTLETSCGSVTLSMYGCACGNYCSDSISTTNCEMFGENKTETDANNVTHEIWTQTCEKCGFVYTRDSWSEYSAECEWITYTKYTLVVNGETAYERSVQQNHGISHDHIQSYNDPVETEENGLRVVTTESTVTCSRCNKLLNTYLAVEKYDENGQLVYSAQTRQDPTTEVEGGLYKAYENEYVYAYYTFNGQSIRYTVSEMYADYNLDGTPWNYAKYEFTYPTEGDYCNGIRKYTDINGTESTEAFVSHMQTYVIYVLSKDSKSCMDGVDRVECCVLCDKEVNRYEKWTTAHLINYHTVFETIDLSQYGAVCGATASVYSCACDERKTLSVDDKCLFDGTYYDQYKDPETQQTYSGTLYTCSVTDPTLCGFRYLELNYHTIDKKCYGYQHSVYLFGFDPETKEYAYQWECTYATKTVMHDFNYRSNETEKDGVRVREEIYSCTNCGVIRERYVNTYYSDEEYGERRDWDYYSYNYTDIDQNYITYHSRSEYITQNLESGQTREIPLREEEHRYDENSVEIYWEISEFDYSNSYCQPDRNCTNSNGENWTNPYTNHWWNYDIEDWENGYGISCTQDAVRIMHCYCCEETERRHYGRYTHSYYYDGQTGVYTCGNCGLESFTGADGYVELEDLTNRWGDGSKYIVGFYNRTFEEYLIGLYLVVGEEEYYLDVEAIVEGTLIYVDVQTIMNIAAEMELGACEYMLRVTFVPVGVDGEYDFAITLDPHVYQVDDANCVIPEDECNGYFITAYKCVCCGDTYKTYFTRGHQNTSERYPIGNCGKAWLYIHTCTVCGDQWEGWSWDEGRCYFEEKYETKTDANGVEHNITSYTCPTCGFVYIRDSVSTALNECQILYTTVFSINLLADGSYEQTVTLKSISYSHSYVEKEISTNSVTDENGNTVTTTVYEYRCTDCNELDHTGYRIITQNADGVELQRVERYEYNWGGSNQYTYTYFIGEDGGRYLESIAYEHRSSEGTVTGAETTTYSYDFTAMIRSYVRTDRNGNIVYSGSEPFKRTESGI